MKTSIFPPSFLRVTVLLALTSQFAFAQKITTFDFPGGLATTPTAISASGRIAGYYGDQQAVAVRAFVRSFNGKLPRSMLRARISQCQPA